RYRPRIGGELTRLLKADCSARLPGRALFLSSDLRRDSPASPTKHRGAFTAWRLASGAYSVDFRRGCLNRVGHDDAVAPLALGGIEGTIGAANDLCGRHTWLELGNSNRHRHAADRRSSRAYSHLDALNRSADALGHQSSDLDRFVVQDYGEF